MAPTTKKQYESALSKWGVFCDHNKIDFYSTSTNNVLSFLTESFESGASYSSLNTYRSAISLISKDKIGEDALITRFLKGVFKLRPSKPKYSQTWDVSVLLNYLKKQFPLEDLSLQSLTEKTVTLVAICTAHRAQTIACIKRSNIHSTARGLEIQIPDLIKTSGPGRYQPLLILPKFNVTPSLCVATALREYLKVTDKIKGDTDKLFLSFKKPHRPVGSQTIGRWVKKVLEKSGVDIATFSAHSTRHASTSAALIKGVDLSVIRKTAGWTDSSQTFARFYNKPIIGDNYSFASAILNSSK